jgi:hypothetical protein
MERPKTNSRFFVMPQAFRARFLQTAAKIHKTGIAFQLIRYSHRQRHLLEFSPASG